MNMENRLERLERANRRQHRFIVLVAAIALVAATVGFVAPFAPPDPEAYTVKTANLAGTSTMRMQVSGSEDTAKVALVNSSVGIGTTSPNVTLDVNGGIATRATTPSQITADQNDYNPGTGTLFRLSSNADRTITGFANGADGRWIVLHNVGSFNLTLANESSSSTAANRVITGISASLVLRPSRSVALQYDPTSSRWRVQNQPTDGLHGVVAVPNSTVSAATSTWTSMNFGGTDTFDTDSYHDPATNNSRITIPAGLGGYYLIYGNVEWAASGTGIRQHSFFVNGTARTQIDTKNPKSGYGVVAHLSFVLYLSGGDYVQVQGWQDTGAALNLGSASNLARFGAVYLGP